MSGCADDPGIWRYRARVESIIETDVYEVTLDISNITHMAWGFTVRLAGVRVPRDDAEAYWERELLPATNDAVKVALMQAPLPGVCGPNFTAEWPLCIKTLGRRCEDGHQLVRVFFCHPQLGWTDLAEHLISRKLARKIEGAPL